MSSVLLWSLHHADFTTTSINRKHCRHPPPPHPPRQQYYIKAATEDRRAFAYPLLTRSFYRKFFLVALVAIRYSSFLLQIFYSLLLVQSVAHCPIRSLRCLMNIMTHAARQHRILLGLYASLRIKHRHHQPLGACPAGTSHAQGRASLASSG